MAIATLIALTALFQNEKGFVWQATELPMLAGGAAQTRRVSASFDNASVADVMKWLTKQGYDFSASDTDLPKDAHITLHVKDKPLGDVLAAIGSSLGGHWDRQGSIYVFRKGGRSGITWAAPGEVFGTPDMDKAWVKGMQMDAKDSQAWAKAMEKQAAEMQKLGTKMQGMQEFKFDSKALAEKNAENSKVWAKEMAKQAEEMKKLGTKLRFETAPTFGKTFDNKVWEQQSADIEKRMTELGRQMEKQFGPEFEKRMEELGKQLQKQFGPEFEKRMREQSGKGVTVFTLPDDGSFAKGFDSRKMRALGKGNRFQTFSIPANPTAPRSPMMTLGADQDLGKLAKSLSAEQLAKHEKQGYLLMSDLTDAQRKMLGHMSSDSTWVITYSNDGHSFTIRSKRPSAEKPGAEPSNLIDSPLFML